MPPIDPMQILNCLRMLLNENTGGFKGPTQAIESVRLMSKYTIKSVSKIVYTLVLKKSSLDLLNVFMDANGWDLTCTWLNDGIDTDNTMLVKDILTILHDVPVTIERLQSSQGPKLVKSLSKFHSNQEIKSLAQELLNRWLLVIRRNVSYNMPSNEERLMKPGTLDKQNCGSKENCISSITLDSVKDKTLEQNINKTKSLNRQDKGKIEKKNSLDLKVKGYSLKIAKEEKEKISKKYKINNDTNESKGEKHHFDGSYKNPFLKIIRKMNNGNFGKDKLIKIRNSNIPKNDYADTKKPFLLPSPKFSVPCSKTSLEKINYSINIQKQKVIGEKKVAVKTFKSKFRSTGLEEVAPSPPCKSKLQSEKSVKSNVRYETSSKAEKRTLSPKLNCSAEKKPKNFSSNNEQLDTADCMQSKTTWQHLDDSMVVEVSYVFGEVNPEPGYYSQEKITQTLREKTVSAVIYSCKNEVPDSPEEPDKSEISLHSRPINIPIDDITGKEPTIYDFSNIPWSETMGHQIPVADCITRVTKPMNVLLDNQCCQESTVHNFGNSVWPEAKDNQPPPVAEIPTVVSMPVLTQNVYYGNQINCSLAPKNMLEMFSFSNKMFILPNQMSNTNFCWLTQIHSVSSQQLSQLHQQPLLLQEQPPLPQHQPPLPQYQPPLPQHQPPLSQQHQPQLPKLVEKLQWMYTYEPNIQHGQNSEHQFFPTNRLPHIKTIKHGEKNKNSYKWGKNTNNCNDILCRDKTSRNMKRDCRELYRRKDSQPSYRRKESRVCRYYARGFCYNTNCPFLH